MRSFEKLTEGDTRDGKKSDSPTKSNKTIFKNYLRFRATFFRDKGSAHFRSVRLRMMFARLCCRATLPSHQHYPFGNCDTIGGRNKYMIYECNFRSIKILFTGLLVACFRSVCGFLWQGGFPIIGTATYTTIGIVFKRLRI